MPDKTPHPSADEVGYSIQPSLFHAMPKIKEMPPEFKFEMNIVPVAKKLLTNVELLGRAMEEQKASPHYAPGFSHPDTPSFSFTAVPKQTADMLGKFARQYRVDCEVVPGHEGSPTSHVRFTFPDTALAGIKEASRKLEAMSQGIEKAVEDIKGRNWVAATRDHMQVEALTELLSIPLKTREVQALLVDADNRGADAQALLQQAVERVTGEFFNERQHHASAAPSQAQGSRTSAVSKLRKTMTGLLTRKAEAGQASANADSAVEPAGGYTAMLRTTRAPEDNDIMR